MYQTVSGRSDARRCTHRVDRETSRCGRAARRGRRDNRISIEDLFNLGATLLRGVLRDGLARLHRAMLVDEQSRGPRTAADDMNTSSKDPRPKQRADTPSISSSTRALLSLAFIFWSCESSKSSKSSASSRPDMPPCVPVQIQKQTPIRNGQRSRSNPIPIAALHHPRGRKPGFLFLLPRYRQHQT